MIKPVLVVDHLVLRTATEVDCPELVAVLCWGGAAKRLKLIVQLRRFYVIDSARRPNLASQCLALSLRTLCGEFQARHGFQPLLAESFHDPEEHTGTLYKATNSLCAASPTSFRTNG